MIVHGDCVAEMAKMPEASVDAVVCDPPYGLEFMNKEWDRLGGPHWGRNDRRWSERPKGGSDPFDNHRPRFGVSPSQMQHWHEAWAREALRVLKPGGHLLAFGGTRTYHRLACAIEDAGFEIRDCLSWMYGSGFPKSLDVSKAIDKRGGNPHIAVEIAAAIRSAREARGMSVRDADQRFCGGTTNWSWFEGRPTGVRPPTSATFERIVNEWPELRPLRAVVEQAEREILGANPNHRNVSHRTSEDVMGQAIGGEHVTAPATPEAQQWQGWGTALKPSHEPVILARKPATDRDILAEIGSYLDTLEGWLAQVADQITRTGEADDSSDQTDTSPSASMVETGLSIAMSWRSCWGELWTDANTSTTSTESSTTTVLKTLWSLLSATTLESIIQGQTPSGGLTSNVRAVGDLFVAAVLSSRATRVLSAEGTATASTPTNSPAEDAESFRPAHEPIVMARKPLAGTVAGNVLEHGTGALNVDGCRIGTDDNTARHTLHSMRGGNFENHQPSERIESGGNGLGRWPANVVLSHHEDCEQVGTRRVKTGTAQEPDGKPMERSIYGKTGTLGRNEGYAGAGGMEEIQAWRCVESCPVRLLDEQSGSLPGGTPRTKEHGKTGSGVTFVAGREHNGFGDQGGTASRFYYVAKASSAERNAGLEGFEEGQHKPYAGGMAGLSDCRMDRQQERKPRRNSHPTVKPIALMRWLVRLVTPPGGVCLDPFAGSGTTGIAARLEGMQFIGIEREEEYVRIAEARIRWWSEHPEGVELSKGLEADRKRRLVADSGQLGFLD
jgi:DNA modification methylase